MKTNKASKGSKGNKAAKASKADKATVSHSAPCAEVQTLCKRLRNAGAETQHNTNGGYITVTFANKRVALINRYAKADKFQVAFAFKPASKNVQKGTNKAWPYRYTGSKPLVAVTKTAKLLRAAEKEAQ